MNKRKIIGLTGCGLAVSAAVLWLLWLCDRDSAVSFLPERRAAEWIIYPKPSVPHRQAVADIPTTFRRSFALQHVGASAPLLIRSCRKGRVTINGQVVAVQGPDFWKRVQELQIGGLLRVGQNSIFVTVSNAVGPPALWLSMRTFGMEITSDSSWEASYGGSVWRPAQIASEPAAAGEGNTMRPPMQDREDTAGMNWLLILGLAAIGAAFVPLGRLLVQRLTVQPLPPRWNWTKDPARLTLAAVLLCWLVLFTHNMGLVPAGLGFDTDGHIEYIKFIQEHHSLPLAGDGWEMHQPPLYYALSAGALSIFGFPAGSFDGLAVLRAFSLGIGLVHVLLVFYSLRALFAEQIVSQILGLIVAGFLPMHLSLTHYVTNESLAACLMSATICAVLMALKTETADLKWTLLAGLLLGLALLTKITALILAPFVGLALLYAAARKTAVPPLLRWGIPICAGLVCLAVCGCHYLRVWRHFGNPFFADTRWAYGVSWWQDPGYHTASYFRSFGAALIQPFFSALAGFADGLFSTAWADGLCSGAGAWVLRPPWNYALMKAGLWLSLLPAALILCGGMRIAISLLRRPDPAWLMLAGFGFCMLLAIAHLNLVVPSYAEAKSIFGMSALIALSACAAAGGDLVSRLGGRWRLGIGAAIGAWAAVCAGAFWIVTDSATTQALLGRGFLRSGNDRAALVHLEQALRTDPENFRARSFYIAALLKQQRGKQALEAASEGVKRHPTQALARLDFATTLEGQGKLEDAVAETLRAVELAPDSTEARLQMAERLFKLRRYPEAIRACREALRLSPTDPEVHFLLGYSLQTEGFVPSPSVALSGDEPLPAALAGSPSPGEILVAEAMNHFRYTIRLAPESPDALNNLAWILATHPRAAFRDGKEAVQLAKQACRLTGSQNADMLGTLAAADAEAGQFADAVSAAGSAQKLCQAQGLEAGVQHYVQMIERFAAHLPYRQPVQPQN